MKETFINESGLDFTDISSEQYRVYQYVYPTYSVGVRIDNPLKLNVSKSGGHRIFDANGISHYLPAGWIHLYWEAKPGKPNFVK